MVSASLFNFISNLFARIHNSDIAFGGISVIVVGDLAQLPPVGATQVFHSVVWHLFFPLFLRQPRRQQSDIIFYQILEEIRLGNISQSSWNQMMKKASTYSTYQSPNLLLTTTHIVGHRHTADQINQSICNTLPVNSDKWLIAEATDFQEGICIDTQLAQAEFKAKTNLPPIVRLQQGARVMFLNNSLMECGICNGTIGIVTDMDDDRKKVQVAFCVHGAIIHKWITRQTVYFYNGGQRASRTQFPLQNSFALTVHKTQGLTLPCVSLALDQTLFSAGQAYVALSRCPKWEHVQIINLHRDAFKTDPEVTKEYQRLQQIATDLSIFRPLTY